jgi:ubiquinol-cytochrome c reductase iron-sulfur subunit
MASLTSTSRSLLRALPRSSLPALPVRALSSSSTLQSSDSFDPPFRGSGGYKTTNIPDFSKYRSNKSTNSNLVFQYFMVGAMGALSAAGAKSTVQGTCRDWIPCVRRDAVRVVYGWYRRDGGIARHSC